MYSLILISLDFDTLSEINRTPVLQHSNRLLVESMLEHSSQFMQNIYQHQQSQYKNALLCFRVIRS